MVTNKMFFFAFHDQQGRGGGGELKEKGEPKRKRALKERKAYN
jgi:hypothetical protein